MPTPRVLIACALAALNLVACQSTKTAYYGSGPLTLAPGAQKAFEDYKQTMTPGMFLVTPDGLAIYYIYCDAGTCSDSISYHAIRTCEAEFSRSCKIYAVGREVVWRFDAAPIGSENSSPSGVESALGDRIVPITTPPVPLPLGWTHIAEPQSRLTVGARESLVQYRRFQYTMIAGDVRARYREQIDLTDGGTIYYEALDGGRFEPGAPIKDFIRNVHAPRLKKDFQIDLAESDFWIKSLDNGEIVFAVAASKVSTCFIGEAIFGSTQTTRLDRHVEIFVCRVSTTWNPKRLEDHVFDILARARIDADERKPFDALAAAPTLRATAPALKASTSGVREFTRPFTAVWNAKEASGFVDFEEGTASGKMRLQHPDGMGQCAGTYSFQGQNNGTWVLDCPRGKTASGTLRLLGSEQGSVGEGMDSDGHRILFRVAVAGR